MKTFTSTVVLALAAAFAVPPAVAAALAVDLVADGGLDTFATVTINGVVVWTGEPVPSSAR